MTIDPGNPCKHCAGPTSRINGRTLRQPPARRDLLKKANDKRWIQICPTCERRNLFDDHQRSMKNDSSPS